MHNVRPGNVIGEHAVHSLRNAFKNIPTRHILLVIGRGRCNGERVPLRRIPFGVHPVQGKGHDGQHVSQNGGLRPGGIDLAAGHVFNVLRIGHPIVRCRVIRPSVVDDHKLRHHNARQHHKALFLKAGQRLHLILRNFRREIPPQGIGRNLDQRPSTRQRHKPLRPRKRKSLLDRLLSGQNLHTRDPHRLKLRRFHRYVIGRIRPHLRLRIQRISHIRRLQCHQRTVAGLVSDHLLQNLIAARRPDRHPRPRYREKSQFCTGLYPQCSCSHRNLHFKAL